ncbi:hypothetical protein ABC977_13080 [Thioalkalicoccus limnaeus]|uniref:Uncharacterized protein n=1 Tax=Thioalkalicoccus limnaeus TaxID=120681 RepID=A0ABV4BGJ3_9GAMM
MSLNTITMIAGFFVGSLLVLIPAFFSFRTRSFGKDSMGLILIGLVMLGLSTWSLVKPDRDTGYIPYEAPTEAQ